ncbi:MAG: discoidin domain-containing protein [Pseudomonadota bacterium]|nr:discoidin domain-containing protein [Pseudomonadota bacterium]
MRKLLLLALLPTLAWAGAKGSSTEKGGKLGANYWSAASAIDGKIETAWMVPGESPNRGEWIEIDIPRGEVDKIAIYPGFGKSDETYADYPRVKQMRVDIFALDDDQVAKQVGSTTIEVPDKREWQTFDLTDAKIDAGLFGGRVRISVMDIHEGQDYPNLGVSEVLVHMKEFDAKVKVTALNDGDAAPAADMLDENPKTAAKLAGTAATMTLESSGFGISSIGFAPMKDYARPKTVEITAGNQTVTTVLPDKATDVQWATVPGFNGYTGGAFGAIEVKILDVYPGKLPEIGVAELKARATNFEAI